MLRDAGKRSSYDSLRGGLGGAGAHSSSAWRPGADNFEDAFDSWFHRQGYISLHIKIILTWQQRIQLVWSPARNQGCAVCATESVIFNGARFKRSMDEQMDEQIRKERREATYRARAAAWETEKAEAQANKVRCWQGWYFQLCQ